MENPLVSVLLASYNHEAYIEASVRSVMSQKGVSFELIVIDDGSRDSSPEILEKLAQELGFVYKHRENKGVMATLSELIRQDHLSHRSRPRSRIRTPARSAARPRR